MPYVIWKSKVKAKDIYEPLIVEPYLEKKYRPVRVRGRTAVKRGVLAQKRPRIRARKYRPQFDNRRAMEERAVPYAKGAGSIQERLFFMALIKWGLQPGIDFLFQEPIEGGHADVGGIVPDFLFPDPKLHVPIHSYWHTVQFSLAAVQRDKDYELRLASAGYTTLPIWPEVVENPVMLDLWIQQNIMRRFGTNYTPGGMMSGSQNNTDLITDARLVSLELKLDKIIGVLNGN